MKKIFIIIALLFLSGEVAHAQQLRVRSGDHPAFTRITLPVSTSQTWEARKTEKGIELTLPGHSGGFDIADVFLRIRRDRIAQITTAPSVLILDVGCTCSATAFRSGDLLVIDVADQGAALAGPPLPEPAIVVAKRSRAAPRSATFAKVTLPWIGGPSPFGRGPTPNGPVANADKTPEQNSRIVDRTILLNEIQQSLIRGVADAASKGMLTHSFKGPATLPQVPQAPSESTDIALADFPEGTTPIFQNMRITSSMDAPGRDKSQLLDVTISGQTCPDEGAFALETWGSNESFSTQIGPARNALVNARDHLDSKAAVTLAQLYLYFGFGAEALEALRLAPSLSRDNPHLADIAIIMEFGSVNGHGGLGTFTNCASEIALWATLSFQDIPQGVSINTKAVLRALNKLPKHLRQILAPELSGRLLQYGDPEAATIAMRSIERLPDQLGPEAVMAQAMLAINAGNSAEESLNNVIETNTSGSPTALIELVEGKLAKGEQISHETMTLIDAYAQELRETPMGDQLRHTQIIALSNSNQFDEAFGTLNALSPSLSPSVAAQLRQYTLERLAQQAETIVFLEHFFAQDAAAFETLPKATKLSLAARLMDLGFAGHVQKILEEIPDKPRSSDRQILAARAALALQQPFQAQSALIGLEHSTARLLLAQAKEMAGDYGEAANIFAASNASEQSIRAAWLSDDWLDLTSSQTPGLGPVATLARAGPPVPTTDLGPLGRANQILEESSAARSTLEQLLRDPIVQIAPDS